MSQLGVQLFEGLFYRCNDPVALNITQCSDSYFPYPFLNDRNESVPRIVRRSSLTSFAFVSSLGGSPCLPRSRGVSSGRIPTGVSTTSASLWSRSFMYATL